MGTLSRLRDFTADRDAVPPVPISAEGIDDEIDQIITESNAQDVRLDAAEAPGHVSTADLAADAGGERGLLATDLLSYIRQLVNLDEDD